MLINLIHKNILIIFNLHVHAFILLYYLLYLIIINYFLNQMQQDHFLHQMYLFLQENQLSYKNKNLYYFIYWILTYFLFFKIQVINMIQIINHQIPLVLMVLFIQIQIIIINHITYLPFIMMDQALIILNLIENLMQLVMLMIIIIMLFIFPIIINLYIYFLFSIFMFFLYIFYFMC